MKILRKFQATILMLAISISICSCSFMGDKGNEESVGSSEEKIDTKEEEETEQSDDLNFPDHVYTYDEIHPKHDNGSVSGDEAVELLDSIEKDTIKFELDVSYVDARIIFAEPEKWGINEPEPSWGEVELSIEDMKEKENFYDEKLQNLYSINRDSLDMEDQVFYDKIVYDMEESKYVSQYNGFNYFESALNPVIGPQSNYIFILNVLEMETEKEAEDYLKLLNDTDRFFDELCEFEKNRVEKGFVSSPKYYEDVAKSFENLAKQKGVCCLYDTFNERISGIDGISDEKKSELISENKRILDEVVFPEFEECAQDIRELKKDNGEDTPIVKYDHGDAYYDVLFRGAANSNSSIESCISELNTLISKMTRNLGMRAMLQKPENSEFNSLYSEPTPENYLSYLKEKMLSDFEPLPEHSYKLMEVPDSLKDNFSPAAYLSYHIDKTTDNLIISNSSKITSVAGVVFAHEGYPGHMYQSIYTRTHNRHPYLVMTTPTAYAEGWATYVENLSYKYYMDDKDVFNYSVNMNLIEILLRGRCDIGVNYEGWDINQCKEYLQQYLGDVVSVDLAKEIYEDIIYSPCNVLKYALGFLKTNEIICTAEQEYPAMSVKDIHSSYLACMPLTFDQIKERISPLIDEKKISEAA